MPQADILTRVIELVWRGTFHEAISGLRPQGLWRHFQEISRIPRESGNEALWPAI
jgi:hypothetical protein